MNPLKQFRLITARTLKDLSHAFVAESLSFLILVSMIGCQSDQKMMQNSVSSGITRTPSSQSLWTTPQQIILIRHGEKIDDSNPGLSPQGCERAFQLPLFFNSLSGKIAGIFAQQPNKSGGSLRPLETIAPTASALHQKINNSFKRDEIDGLAQEILNGQAYKGNTVIVAWEHSIIPKLAERLGITLTGNLSQWPGSVFDQAWIISYPNSNSSTPILTIVSEHILPTDISYEQSGIENWNAPESHQVDPTIQIPNSVVSECQSGNQSLDALVTQDAIHSVPGL